MEQIRKGHNYQNKLIEIERWRRNEIRTIERQAGDIPELEVAVKEADDKVIAFDKRNKRANADARTRVATDEMKQELRDAKKARKEINSKLIEARRLLRSNEDIKAKRTAIDQQANLKIAEVRKSDIAPWYGTYMLIEDAFQKTRKMPLYDGVEPNDPRFRSYLGEGRVGIQQFQPNEPIDKVIGIEASSKMVRIIPMPAPIVKVDGTMRKVGKKDLRLFRLRIGTDNDRKPIWAEFPMVYHRDIPTGSVIQVVQVCCNKIGAREHWTVSITFNDNQNTIAHNNQSCVGIDLGWRDMQDGSVRIGYGKGTDNKEWDIRVPSSVIAALSKANEIESIRDKEFDAVRKSLVEWMTGKENLPEWLTKECEHLDKWRSQGRLARLVKQWSTNRFAGDEEIYGISGSWNKETKTLTKGTGIAGWRYHDHHLWQWASSQRNRGVGYRNEEYRKLAAKLADQYGSIVFEDINLSNLARGNAGSTNRQLTAPSEFRNACKNALRSRGKTEGYIEVDARGTSKECGICHYYNDDIKGMLKYFCQGCGVEHDRDENASNNILDRGLERERSGDAKTPEGARNEETLMEVA
jgi:hypothetical protein